jgi:hypothetical protein
MGGLKASSMKIEGAAVTGGSEVESMMSTAD